MAESGVARQNPSCWEICIVQPCFPRRRRRDTGGEFEKDVNSVETVYPFLEEISQLGGLKRLNEIECQKVLTQAAVLTVNVRPVLCLETVL